MAFRRASFLPTYSTECQHYSWPGNVSELENFVKRYLMIGDESSICLMPGDLVLPKTLEREDSRQLGWPGRRIGYEEPNGKSLKSLIRDVKSQAERNAIAAALEKNWMEPEGGGPNAKSQLPDHVVQNRPISNELFGPFLSTFRQWERS